MYSPRVPLLICLVALLPACGQQQDAGTGHPGSPKKPLVQASGTAPYTSPYDRFRADIMAGKASRAEVLAALDETDIMGLSNTLLQLYVMRQDPGVSKILRRLWQDPQGLRPEVNNPLLARAAARVALAHTLQRIHPDPVYIGFIRTRLKDADPFVRAQAVLALGFVGDDQDIPAMRKLALDADAYVAGVAVKALAIRGSPAAGKALLELKRHYGADPRLHAIIRQVLLERFPALMPGQASRSD